MAGLTLGRVCSPWVTVEDVEECGGDLALDDLDLRIAEAIDLASDLLYTLSRSQYPGACTKTVRPCAERTCLDGVYAPYQSTDPNTDPDHAGTSACSCGRDHLIDLGVWPIIDITEVLVDGAVLDSSLYSVDQHRYLRHMAGPGPDYVNVGWPRCQYLDRPTTEPGTWSVTVRYGVAPPPMGVRGAAVLANQLVRSCAGQDCQLPGRVSSVLREGISMTLIDPQMLSDGLTGVFEADLFLKSVNPKGLRGGALVWSPDLTSVP